MNRNLEIIYNAIKPLTNEFVVRPLLGDAISDGIIRYYQLNKDILKLPEIDYAEMLISAFDNTILNNEKFLQTSYNYFLGQKIIELLSEKNNIDNTLSLTNDASTVDLSAYVNTDSQNLTSATLSGNTLTIQIENGTSVDVDLSPILSALQTEKNDPLSDLMV